MPRAAKILIADDSAFMRKVVIETLRSAGFSDFVEAENGVEALAEFNQARPDLVLLDVIMPEKDGLEVIKAIGSQAKVIMVSAIGQEGVIREAMSHGAKGYVIKPFDKEKIIAEIERVLGGN